MNKEWKEIPNRPRYEASNLGQIRNKKGRILVQRKNRKGD